MAVLLRGLWLHKKGTWYFTRMRNGVRKTVALGTKDEKEAQRRALKILDGAELKLALSGSLKSEIEAFIAFKVNRNEFSRFSAENKSLTLHRFARCIGEDTAITSIKTATLQNFYNEERKRVTESTAQGYMMCLRSFFKWLHKERKVIASNPTNEITMGRWDYGSKTQYCPPPIRDAMINAWKSIPDCAMSKDQARMVGFVLHCGFDAGLRKNEIIEARPDWFNISSRSIRVQRTDTFTPKDRESRSIPLTDNFIEFLKDYPMNGTWCIAPGCQRGKSRYRYDFLAPFETYRDFVSSQLWEELEWMTPHIMRHTFGSLLAIAGESLMKISEWMGDDPRITERHYLHFQEGDKAINRLYSFSQTQPPPQAPVGPQHISASSTPSNHHSQKA